MPSNFKICTQNRSCQLKLILPIFVTMIRLSCKKYASIAIKCKEATRLKPSNQKHSVASLKLSLTMARRSPTKLTMQSTITRRHYCVIIALIKLGLNQHVFTCCRSHTKEQHKFIWRLVFTRRCKNSMRRVLQRIKRMHF